MNKYDYELKGKDSLHVEGTNIPEQTSLVKTYEGHSIPLGKYIFTTLVFS